MMSFRLRVKKSTTTTTTTGNNDAKYEYIKGITHPSFRIYKWQRIILINNQLMIKY